MTTVADNSSLCNDPTSAFRVWWVFKTLPLIPLMLGTVTAFAQTGWVWQNPRPTGNDLFTVDFIDEFTGMAIGGFGTVMRTTNGGATWQTHVADGLRDIHDFAGLDLLDAESGIVLGWDQVFLTRDGGYTWSTILDFTGLDVGVRDCSFSSNQTISCVDGTSGFWRTLDSGITWSRTELPPDIAGLEFISDAEGWAVGSRLMTSGGDEWREIKILHTADGGQSWEPQTAQLSDPTTALWKVHFADELTGVAWGSSIVLNTSDGGGTWHLPGGLECNRLAGLCFAGSPEDVRLTDSLLGVASFYDKVYLTRDGGANWELVPDSDLNNVRASVALSPSELVVVGTSGLDQTRDGGATWESLPESFLDEHLDDVWFTDANTGTVVGDSGTILRTADAGQTWESQTSGTDHWLHAVAFSGSDVGVAVGDSVIVLTTDGGITWTEATATADAQGNWRMFDVDCADKDVFVAVTSWPAHILRSEDGGATWYEQYHLPNGNLYTVSFSDAATGYAMGWDGNTEIVLRTTDGGRTWELSETDLPYPPEFKVSFADENTGFAAVNYDLSDGRIYRTDDGGNTWQFQMGVSAMLFGVYAIDRDVATVVGGWGTILRTETGGVFVSIEEDPGIDAETPRTYLLEQNYPNPLNPSTTISYDLPRRSDVMLAVYDVLGRQIRQLVSGSQPTGTYEVTFDATALPSGIYFYRLQAGDYVETKRMVVVK